MNSRRFWKALLLVTAGGLFAGFAGIKLAAPEPVAIPGSQHQTLENQPQESGGTEQNVSTGNNKDGRSFIVAPLPISSPALGSGIVPVFAYIFPIEKTDKASPRQ
ncbi:MAG: hypothetical protein WA817_20220 [Candidatus Acidiferrum sp.]